MTHMKEQEKAIIDREVSNASPSYPNFMAAKSGEPYYGGIGWGVENPKLVDPPSKLVDHVQRGNHVISFDRYKEAKFIDLTGEFKRTTDNKLDINPEIYHLMNQSSQKISIKNLDSQRQNFTKTFNNS